MQYTPIKERAQQLAEQAAAVGLTLADLITNTGDADRVERAIGEARHRRVQRDFRALAAKDAKAAFKSWRDAPGDRARMQQAFHEGELVAWLRALPERDREAVLATFADASSIRASLVDLKDLARYVKVSVGDVMSEDDLRASRGTVSRGFVELRGELTAAQARKLRNLGLGEHVRDPRVSAFGPGEHEPHRLVGTLETAAMTAEAWEALLEASPELERAVATGHVRVSDMPREYARARLQASFAAAGAAR